MNGFSDPTADHGSWEYNLQTGEIYWSEGVYRLHGVSPGEFDTTYDEIRTLVHSDDLERYGTSVADAVATRSAFAVQHRIVRPDGAIRTVVVRGEYMLGPDGQADRLVGTTQDVTGREGAEERLWHLANHDSLTGLFNRRRLMEELTREVAVARRSGIAGAVLMLDLDRFKDINDSLGHVAGDNLLARVAEGLRRRLRATDTLARIGGDEFAIVLPGCSEIEARTVGEHLLEALRDGASVRIAGRERRVSASVGVAPFGAGAEQDADGLLVEADLAMYRAKQEGSSRVEVFDEEMRAELAARVQIEGELREALERGAARGPLSADRRAGRRLSSRRGGTGSLAPPAPRDGQPRRVRPGRRGARPDRTRRLAGSSRRVHGGPQLARGRAPRLRLGQRLAPSAGAKRYGAGGLEGARRDRPSGPAPVPRDHRDVADRRRGHDRAGAGGDPQARA